LISFVVSTLLAAGMRAGAAWGRAPASVADLDRCPLPCWRGITSGETTLEMARALLHERGYGQRPVSRFFTNPITFERAGSDECLVRIAYGFGIVADVVLHDCPDVRIGDVMAALGEPDGYVAPHILSFRSATVFVEIVGRRSCNTPFSPRTRVENIFIMPASYPINTITQVADLGRLNRWQGFMSGAHYLARERPGVCS
jgi:hypothetical protein